MVYDRYNKATTAKYSRSISHNRHSHIQENSRKEGGPPHQQAHHQAVQSLDAVRYCLDHEGCLAHSGVILAPEEGEA